MQERHGAYYVSMSEQGREKMLNESGARTFPENSMVLGAAGEFNLDLLARNRLSGMLALAPDSDQNQMWRQNALKFISHCQSPREFLHEMRDMLIEKVHLSDARSPRQAGQAVYFNAGRAELREMEARLAGKGPDWQWTANQESYDFVRCKVKDGEVAALYYNLMKPAHALALSEIMEQGGRVPGIVYDSNVLGYYIDNIQAWGDQIITRGYNGDQVLGNPIEIFRQGMNQLLRNAPDALIIEGSMRGSMHALTQGAHNESLQEISLAAILRQKNSLGPFWQ